MKKITIKIPKNNNGKWMLGLGARPRSMMRSDTLINRIKRELPSWLKVNNKTAIKVLKYNGIVWENINETSTSTDEHYLIYTASCFLEDYLSKNILTQMINKYATPVAGDVWRVITVRSLRIT